VPGGRSASDRCPPSWAGSHLHPERDSIPTRTRLRHDLPSQSHDSIPVLVKRLIIDAKTLMSVILMDHDPPVDSATRPTPLSWR
jgi:hypothetical protein